MPSNNSLLPPPLKKKENNNNKRKCLNLPFFMMTCLVLRLLCLDLRLGLFNLVALG